MILEDDRREADVEEGAGGASAVASIELDWIDNGPLRLGGGPLDSGSSAAACRDLSPVGR